MYEYTKYYITSRQALTNILERGIQQQTFKAMNAQQNAYDMHQAMICYNHPVSLKHNVLELLEEDLKRLLQLFYQGMKT